MKIKFTTDYSPRKKGEIFEAKTRDEKKLAQWYVDNGIAKECTCSTPSGCPDCEAKAKAAAEANRSETPVFSVEREDALVDIFEESETTVKEIKAELDKRKISYVVTGKPLNKTELFNLLK